MTGIIIADILFQLFGLGMLLIPLIILIFIFRLVKKMDRRAEERLQLDRELAANQQEQTNELSELKARLTNIEKVLKEVD